MHALVWPHKPMSKILINMCNLICWSKILYVGLLIIPRILCQKFTPMLIAVEKEAVNTEPPVSGLAPIEATPVNWRRQFRILSRGHGCRLPAFLNGRVPHFKSVGCPCAWSHVTACRSAKTGFDSWRLTSTDIAKQSRNACSLILASLLQLVCTSLRNIQQRTEGRPAHSFAEESEVAHSNTASITANCLRHKVTNEHW